VELCGRGADKERFCRETKKVGYEHSEGGRVCINKNGENGPYFKTHRGLRQGDPLSPLLFNLAADALAYILDNAKELGLIRGVVPHLIQGGLTHLQYVDDTVCVKEMTSQYKV
jgi:hypothetical protein